MVSPNASSNSGSLEEQVQDLINHYNHGQFEVILSKVETLIALYPKAAVLFNIKGIALKNKGDLEGAINSYKQAIKIEPNFADAYLNLGAAMTNKGNLEAAIDSCNKAIKIQPGYAEAYLNISIALMRQGDLDGAIDNSRQAVKLKPDFAEAYHNLGDSLFSKGDLVESIDCYRQALKIAPENVQAYEGISGCLRHYIWGHNNRISENLGKIDNLIELEKQKLKIKIKKYSLWFVDIPWTSSTAIKILSGNKFGWPFGPNRVLNDIESHNLGIARSVLLPDHTPAFIAKRFIGDELWNEIDTFAVVRNPYSWCSSIWHYAMKYNDLRLKTNSFDQFLGSFEEKLEGDFTKRWIFPSNYRQTDYLLDTNDKMLVKQVLRFEDKESIASSLSMRGIFDYSKSPRYGETGSSNYQITKSEMKKIERILAKDFDILGY